MKIRLAESAGFCFGVQRALDIALKTAASCKKVYMLGDIVHNEDVIKRIEDAGIKKISRLSAGRCARALLIRAHGASIATIAQAKRFGYTIFNATCPMVKEIHHIAQRMEKKGYHIIVIGDKKHDEVKGIIGQLTGKATVIDSLDSPAVRTIARFKKAAVVVQSTQNIDKVLAIAGILKRRIQDLQFFNTVCRPTRLKQEEMKSIPLHNDVMIVIGSKRSANTKRMYEISKSLNAKTYWVSSKGEIQRKWFGGIKSVGITAGASTPDSTTQDVINHIKKIAPQK